jgi:ADP-ribose pyrophosphatase YjhB (NUDIX family)
MEIKLSIKNSEGVTEDITYRDIESEADFMGRKIRGCRAYSFYKDKFVLVYNKPKDYWSAPGGGVEDGEHILEAIKREVKEETNMKVLAHRFIGLVESVLPDVTYYYITSVCLLEPLGDFKADPDGDITEIKLIDIKDYKEYSDSNVEPIVDRQIARAAELKIQMEKELGLV